MCLALLGPIPGDILAPGRAGGRDIGPYIRPGPRLTLSQSAGLLTFAMMKSQAICSVISHIGCFGIYVGEAYSWPALPSSPFVLPSWTEFRVKLDVLLSAGYNIGVKLGVFCRSNNFL